jgi:hypothetical protein
VNIVAVSYLNFAYEFHGGLQIPSWEGVARSARVGFLANTHREAFGFCPSQEGIDFDI